jgi:hypothetical protein
MTIRGYLKFAAQLKDIPTKQINVQIDRVLEDCNLEDVRDKMMASKMLWSIKDRTKTMANPKHEQLVSFAMQRPEGQPQKSHRFATDEDALAAIERGAVDLYDDVEVVP